MIVFYYCFCVTLILFFLDLHINGKLLRIHIMLSKYKQKSFPKQMRKYIPFLTFVYMVKYKKEIIDTISRYNVLCDFLSYYPFDEQTKLRINTITLDD